MTSGGVGSPAVLGVDGAVELRVMKGKTVGSVVPAADGGYAGASFCDGSLEEADGTTVLRFTLPWADDGCEGELEAAAAAPTLAICKGAPTTYIVAHGRGAVLGSHAPVTATATLTRSLAPNVTAVVVPPPAIDLSLYWLHVAVMAPAWMLLAPLGAALARHGKQPLKSSLSPGGPAGWFVLHRAVQICTVLLTIVGFIVAIVMIGSAPHFASAHGVCGLVVVLLALAQGAFGVLRPGKDHKWRGVWSASHRYGGHLLVLCGLITATLGGFALDEKKLGIDLLRGEIGAGAVLLVVAVLWGFGFFGLEALAFGRRARRPTTFARSTDVRVAVPNFGAEQLAQSKLEGSHMRGSQPSQKESSSTRNTDNGKSPRGAKLTELSPREKLADSRSC